MVCCVVDEKDYSLQILSLGVRNQVTQMFSKLNVSSSIETIPNNVFLRPEK